MNKDDKFCLACGKKVEQVLAKRDESIKEKLWQEAMEYRCIEDLVIGDSKGNTERLARRIDYLRFDREEGLLMRRAERWAEYKISGMSLDDWYWALSSQNGLAKGVINLFHHEDNYMPTDKPKAHKALFGKYAIFRLEREALERGYLQYNHRMSRGLVSHYAFNCLKVDLNDAQEFIDSTVVEPIEEPDFTELEREAREEAKLFPPPKEIEAEAPGGIMLTFTSDEAAVLVYLDSVYLGKEIKLNTLFGAEESFTRKERAVSRGSVAVAIFNHIPFVTDYLKHLGKVVTQLHCEIESFYFDDPYKKGERITLEEKVTVFRGKVKVVDWRGKI